MPSYQRRKLFPILPLEFLQRDMLHVVGMADSLNCKLSGFPGCMDNELATTCAAMLQGDNRLDRFFRYRQHILETAVSDWLSLPGAGSSSTGSSTTTSSSSGALSSAYLPVFPMHGLVYVPGLGHDPVAMVQSAEGRCALFEVGCISESRILLFRETNSTMSPP